MRVYAQKARRREGEASGRHACLIAGPQRVNGDGFSFMSSVGTWVSLDYRGMSITLGYREFHVYTGRGWWCV